jgi:hypothetical protein
MCPQTYGVDMEEAFSGAAAETIRLNTARVGNAVLQLSEQLYSKDLHWVMELLQVGLMSGRVGIRTRRAFGWHGKRCLRVGAGPATLCVPHNLLRTRKTTRTTRVCCPAWSS